MPSTAERELNDLMKSLESEDPEQLASYWALAGRLHVYPKWAVDSMSQYHVSSCLLGRSTASPG